MGQSPTLRPLTMQERSISWFYGLLPCSFAYILLRLGAVLLELLEGSGFFTLPRPPDLELPLPFVDFGLPLIDLPLILSRIFYPVAYFTLGRSPGHALVDAYIVDRNTLRRIGPGRKLLRSLFQVAIGPIFIVFDMMSVGLTLVDREQRRSLNDWVAGTLVVTGDVPLAPERVSWRQRLEELSRALRPRPAAAPAR